MNLHEWGDESDCFTKEDLTTLFVHLCGDVHVSHLTFNRKHTMKDTETRARTVTVVKKGDETDGMFLHCLLFLCLIGCLSWSASGSFMGQ